MSLSGDFLFETQTQYNHYQVRDTVYAGRPARVLYSGDGQAAQSGLARDTNPDLLFDYNQRLLELITGLQSKKVLLIGGGMYTLPTALLLALPEIEIDVIEIDAQLDAIASRFFDFKPGPRLRVQHTDGRTFLDNNQKQFDMILIDAFTHTSIPESLTNPSAAQAVKKNLATNGVVAINVISSYFGQRSDTIKRLAIAYETVFPAVDIFPASHGLSMWLPQNFVLVAHQKRLPLNHFMRYPPVSEVS